MRCTPHSRIVTESAHLHNVKFTVRHAPSGLNDVIHPRGLRSVEERPAMARKNSVVGRARYYVANGRDLQRIVLRVFVGPPKLLERIRYAERIAGEQCLVVHIDAQRPPRVTRRQNQLAAEFAHIAAEREYPGPR